MLRRKVYSGAKIPSVLLPIWKFVSKFDYQKVWTRYRTKSQVYYSCVWVSSADCPELQLRWCDDLMSTSAVILRQVCLPWLCDGKWMFFMKPNHEFINVHFNVTFYLRAYDTWLSCALCIKCGAGACFGLNSNYCGVYYQSKAWPPPVRLETWECMSPSSLSSSSSSSSSSSKSPSSAPATVVLSSSPT